MRQVFFAAFIVGGLIQVLGQLTRVLTFEGSVMSKEVHNIVIFFGFDMECKYSWHYILIAPIKKIVVKEMSPHTPLG